MHVLDTYTPPTEPWLDILYEDEDILVLNKPSGLLTVPGKPESHHDCLEARVREKFVGARIIHRLDMDTSGLVVMARHKEAQTIISKQFEKRETKKRYIARLYGEIKEDEGVIDLPLICDWPNRPRQKVDFQQGKQAITKYRVLSREAGATRVEFIPVTGRSHQLRVHALSLGHPIIGDNLYGCNKSKAAANRLQLHACYLNFKHPSSGKDISFSAELPF